MILRLSGLLLFAAVLLVSQGIANPVEDFTAKWQETEDKQTRLELVTTTIANADNLDVIREIQSVWEDYDKPSALAWFKGRVDADPSATNLYLYGRLHDPADAVVIARQVIEADPDFPYGYRLLVVPYMTVLKGDEDTAEYRTLKASFDDDYQLLLNHRDQLLSDPTGYGLLYETQALKKDYTGQLVTLHAAADAGQAWANGNRIGRAYAGLGQFDKARDAINSYLDEAIAAGKLDASDKGAEAIDIYVDALADVKAYDEGIRYLNAVNDEELKPLAHYYLAQAWLAKDKPGKALSELEMMAKRGWDRVGKIEGNEGFEAISDESRFAAVVEMVKANRAAGADARRAEALADRMDTPAPDLSLKDVDGNALALADYRGKVVVIDFWATWCGPCRMAMPEINKFTRAAGDDVVVISLNVWENAPDKARQFMVENDYAMKLMWSTGEAKPTDLYEVTGIPTLVVIDPDGVIRYKEVGYEEGLQEKLTWFAEDLLANDPGRASLPNSH